MLRKKEINTVEVVEKLAEGWKLCTCGEICFCSDESCYLSGNWKEVKDGCKYRQEIQ